MSDQESLPHGWVKLRLSEVLDRLASGRLLDHGWSPQCLKHPSQEDSDWGVLKTTAIQDGGFHAEHNKALPPQLAPKQGLEVNSGDLLLTCAGPRSRCGVPCLVRATRPRLILSGKMYRFRCNQDVIDPEYLELLLRSPKSQSSIDAMKTGISDSGLNLTHEKFLDLEVPLAPRNEQTRIWRKAKSALDDVGVALVAIDRAKSNLDRYRESVLQSAVTGALTAEWRKTNPAKETGKALLDRILRERRERWENEQLASFAAKGKQPPKGWQDKYEEPSRATIAELPSGWASARMSECCEKIQDGTHFSPPADRQQQSGAFPYITAKNVRKWGLDLDSLTFLEEADHRPIFNRCDPACGDVLLVKDGVGVGDACIYTLKSEASLLSSVCMIRTTPSVLDAGFLRYFLISAIGQRSLSSRTTGTAITRIILRTIRDTPVPIPPLEEQTKIVSELDHLLSRIAETESAIQARIAVARTLRQSILKAAFEGRLVPQDPNDEPASVLLERIKAKSSAAESPKTKITKRRKAAAK